MAGVWLVDAVLTGGGRLPGPGLLSTIGATDLLAQAASKDIAKQAAICPAQR
jgi:hypothetical protein